MAVEQQAGLAVVDHPGAALLHLGRRRHAGGGKDGAALQEHAALVEHAGIDVHRHRAAAAPRDDGVDRRRQGAHMVPVAVRDGDLLDRAEVEPEVAAVADEDRAFGAGVEQHRVLAAAGLRTQAQAIAQVGGQQRLAGDLRGARQHDVGEFRHREGRLADVGVADIVGEDVDGEGVDDGKGRRLVRFGAHAVSHSKGWPQILELRRTRRRDLWSGNQP